MPHKAVITPAPHRIAITELEVPSPKEGEILVRNFAAGHNPLDWQAVYRWPDERYNGHILGCDYSGIIEKCGLGVTHFKKGDRVAGNTFGGVQPFGSFGEYCVADAGLAMPLPESLTFEQGAAFGVAVGTAGLAFFKYLGIPWPEEGEVEPDTWMMVHGGSTVSGTMAIQYARNLGINVVATCSPRNYELVKSYGAQETFDRNDTEVGAKIKEWTKGKVTLALNCTDDEEYSVRQCSESMSDKGGKAINLVFLDTSKSRSEVEWMFFLAFESWDVTSHLAGMEFPPHPDGRAVSLKNWQLAGKWLAEGKLKPHPVKVVPGGLDGAENALKQLMNKSVSGAKLVSTLRER